MRALRRGVPIIALVIVPLVVTACRKNPEAPASSTEAGASVSAAPAAAKPETPAPSGSPLGQRELPTTAPAIALGNLEASLTEADARLGRGKPSAEFLAQLAGMHLAHGRIVGRIDEYEQAAALAERAV